MKLKPSCTNDVWCRLQLHNQNQTVGNAVEYDTRGNTNHIYFRLNKIPQLPCFNVTCTNLLYILHHCKWATGQHTRLRCLMICITCAWWWLSYDICLFRKCECVSERLLHLGQLVSQSAHACMLTHSSLHVASSRAVTTCIKYSWASCCSAGWNAAQSTETSSYEIPMHI